MGKETDRSNSYQRNVHTYLWLVLDSQGTRTHTGESVQPDLLRSLAYLEFSNSSCPLYRMKIILTDTAEKRMRGDERREELGRGEERRGEESWGEGRGESREYWKVLALYPNMKKIRESTERTDEDGCKYSHQQEHVRLPLPSVWMRGSHSLLFRDSLVVFLLS